MKLASYRTFIEQSCLVKSSELRNTRRLRFSFFTSDVIHASARRFFRSVQPASFAGLSGVIQRARSSGG